MNLFILIDPAQQDAMGDNLTKLSKQYHSTLSLYNPLEQPDWPEESRVLLCLSDAQIREVLLIANKKRWQVGLLPHPESPIARRAMGYSNRWDEAVADATQDQAAEIDLLLCNGLPILRSIVIGDTFGFRPGGAVSKMSERFIRFWSALKQLNKLIPQQFQIETNGEEKINTAAIGLTVVEHGNNSVIGHQLLPDSAINDGRCHCIILAPRSIMELLLLVMHSLFARSSASLPRCIGLVASSGLTITNGKGIHYMHDELAMGSRELEIQCMHKGLWVLPGSAMEITPPKSESKESRKLQHIPSGSAALEMVQKPLGWVAHAAPDEFKELYQALRDNAKSSAVFSNLMILSTTLAAIGLFANSSPVIIGAMILAPLMGPIISMSMAIVRQDAQLLEGSISTLVTGLLLAMGFAALLSMIIPISQITPEIAARTQPNLLDLGVAIISGVAGAYAHARASIAKSLAGVAISVALVPPLAVTGIGIGWFNLDLIYGAFLLFLTNLSGILLASALTFLALGFAPFRRAKRGLTLSAIAVAIVSIPLAITFQGMIKKGRIQEQIERLTFEKVTLSNLTLKSTDPLVISAQLVSNETISDEERHMVKLRIEQQLGQPIVLESSSVLRLE